MKKSLRLSRNSTKRIRLSDMEIRYDVEHRNVNYPRLEFKKDRILVILPQGMTNEKDFLERKSDWILRKQKTINNAVKCVQKKDFMLLGNPIKVMHSPEFRFDFDKGEIGIDKKNKEHAFLLEKNLRLLLRERLKDSIELYGRKLDVKSNRLFIRKQKTKWGSCSKNKNLSFNLKLVYLPERVIRYVVYHELVHIKERRHNSNFWKHIQKEFKDYPKMEKSLLGFWFHLDNSLVN
jgi:predicted metal-dependent hydrolase